MRVLIACEESQEVCKAFRKRGHEAYSCDIQECSGGHPEWHIQCDVLGILEPPPIIFTTDDNWHHIPKWDLIIAHPPCTHLAVSGARWFPEKQKDFRQQKAIVFFMQLMLADCPHIAVENPVGIMSSCYRKPDQIIQPFYFGDPHRKSTCLWLKNLPLLISDNKVEPIIKNYTCKNGRQVSFDIDYIAGPSVDRGKKRSKTYPGIARAMSEQWGGL